MREFIQQALQRSRQGERGVTGLETAIILIAFVVVATVFAFIVLTTGIYSSERGKETVFAGLQKARGTMEIRGGVLMTALTTNPAIPAVGPAETACNGVDDDADLTIDDGCPASIATGSIQYAVSTAPAGSPIPMDPTATVLRTVVAYRDSTSFDHDVPYTITVINGDADLLLEPGELFIVTVDVTDIVDTISALPVVITANKRWTLEIQTPVGATIDLTRSMPGELNAVMQLH